MAKRRVLVLGGAGFIGFELAKVLASEGPDTEVVLVDNLSRGRRDLEVITFLESHSWCRLIDADLTLPDQFRALGEGYDEVYLLAAIVGVRYAEENPGKVVAANTQIVLNTLEWAKSGHVRRLLFASTSEVYAGGVDLGIIPVPTPETVPLVIGAIKNPRFSYAASKLLGEAAVFGYALSWGLSVVVVRFHNVYGPRMGYEHVIPELSMRAIRKEDPFRVYGSEQTRAFCFVTDAVQGMLLAMRKGKDSEVYNIGNDQEEVQIDALAKAILRLAEYHPALLSLPAPAGSVNRRCPDMKSLRALGFAPAMNLVKGLACTLSWYRTNAQHQGAAR